MDETNISSNPLIIFKDKIKEVFKLGSIYIVGSIFQNLVYFFLIPVYTTYLNTEDYGIYGLMSITALIVLNITKTPTSYSFVRFYYSPDFENRRKELLFNCILFALFQSSIVAILFFLFSGNVAELILAKSEYFYIVQLYCLIFLLQPLENIIQDLLKIQKKAKLFTSILILNVIFTTTLIIYFLVIEKIGVMALIYGALFTTIFPIFILMPFLLKNLKFKFDINILKEALSYGYPLIFAVVSFYLLRSVDQYIIKSILSVSYVGLYSFGYNFGWLIAVFFVLPMSNILEPVIFQMEKNKYEQKNFVREITRYVFFIGIIMWLVLALFGKEIIELMARNQEFWNAWEVVPTIGFAYLIYGLVFIYSKGLEIEKKTKLISLIYIVVLILNICLNLLLIPLWGIQGSALSLLISMFFLFWFIYIFSKKLCQWTLNTYSLIGVSVIAIVIFFISLFIRFDNLLYLFLIKLLLLFSFFVIIFLSKIFKKEELINLYNFLKINK